MQTHTEHEAQLPQAGPGNTPGDTHIIISRKLALWLSSSESAPRLVIIMNIALMHKTRGSGTACAENPDRK